MRNRKPPELSLGRAFAHGVSDFGRNHEGFRDQAATVVSSAGALRAADRLLELVTEIVVIKAAFEDRPHLESYDQDAFVRLGAYRHIPAAALVSQFRTISEPTAAFLRGLDASAWERVGIHDERGALTLREIVAIEAEHEREHVEQIERMARQA